MKRQEGPEPDGTEPDGTGRNDTGTGRAHRPVRRPVRRHRLWPGTVITLLLLWILLIFLLIHNGPRPADRHPASAPAAAQDFHTLPGPWVSSGSWASPGP